MQNDPFSRNLNIFLYLFISFRLIYRSRFSPFFKSSWMYIQFVKSFNARRTKLSNRMSSKSLILQNCILTVCFYWTKCFYPLRKYKETQSFLRTSLGIWPLKREFKKSNNLAQKKKYLYFLSVNMKKGWLLLNFFVNLNSDIHKK